MSKICTICKKTKSEEDFYWNKTKNRFQSECKECTKKRSKKYREEHPDKIKQMRQNYKEIRKTKRYDADWRFHLKKRYKLTEEQYKKMYDEQNGKCLICEKKEDFRKLCVDHSHKNKRVRGLLCKECNFAIGIFKDDVSLLQNAINYLRRFINE